MRIGVDVSCWANGRGYGRFTRQLLRAMAELGTDDEFVCFADARTVSQLDLSLPNVRPVPVRLGCPPATAASADGRRSVADMLRLTRAVAGEPLDAFFSPSVYTYFPIPPRLPVVVTIHDVIAERFPELTLPSRRARWFWRLKVWAALRQADLILTVSEFSAGELARVLGVDPGRIRVACEAPSSAYRPSRSEGDIRAAAARIGLPPGARWFVYVGGFNPHKNVELLIRAHATLTATPARLAPYLLLVGSLSSDVFHRDPERIRQAIEQAGTADRVVWTGFVADEELRHLHSGALALVLPSAAEGFGLPAVEAAACGAPVIATLESPLPQLLQGGGLFVRPGDERELAQALGRLADDEPTRQRLGRVARDRAERLTWRDGASSALAALREAAA